MIAAVTTVDIVRALLALSPWRHVVRLLRRKAGQLMGKGIVRFLVSSMGSVRTDATILFISSKRRAAKSRANRQRGIRGVGVNNGSWADRRRWWNLHQTGRVNDRCWVDSRHPDTHLIRTEEVADEGLEVDPGVGVVEERQFLEVTGQISGALGAPLAWDNTYFCNFSFC